MSVMKPLMQPLIDRRDPYWDKVVSLLHFDGDFKDEVGNAFTSMRGLYEQGVFEFGGAKRFTSPLDMVKGDNIYMGAENFTMECWFKLDRPALADEWFGIFSVRGSIVSDVQFALFIIEKSSSLNFAIGESKTTRHNLTSNAPLSVGNWQHIAICRIDDNFIMFIDGIQSASMNLGGFSLYNQPSPLVIGALHQDINRNNEASNGSIDEFRITKGVARYTKNFTPPQKPFPNK